MLKFYYIKILFKNVSMHAYACKILILVSIADGKLNLIGNMVVKGDGAEISFTPENVHGSEFLSLEVFQMIRIM